MEEYRALGMMELKSIARGYEAADQLVKTADVEFVTAVTTCPGKFIIIIRGEMCISDRMGDVGEELFLRMQNR